MTVHLGDHELVLDPYDYDFHEDPYPYYRRLRDEAPLYRNEELKFWAVSRHGDVLQGFRNSTTLSNKYGVSLDPASRGPHASKTMSFLARGHRWCEEPLPVVRHPQHVPANAGESDADMSSRAVDRDVERRTNGAHPRVGEATNAIDQHRERNTFD